MAIIIIMSNFLNIFIRSYAFLSQKSKYIHTYKLNAVLFFKKNI